MNAHIIGTKRTLANAASSRSGVRAGCTGAILAMLMASSGALAADGPAMNNDAATGHEPSSVAATANDARARASGVVGKASRALTRASGELLEGMSAFQDLLAREPSTHDGELVAAVQWRQ